MTITAEATPSPDRGGRAGAGTRHGRAVPCTAARVSSYGSRQSRTHGRMDVVNASRGGRKPLFPPVIRTHRTYDRKAARRCPGCWWWMTNRSLRGCW